MVRQKAKDPEAVNEFLNRVADVKAGGYEVTGKGAAGCELTFTTANLYFETLQNAADETGLFLDQIDFEQNALRFFVAGDEEEN